MRLAGYFRRVLLVVASGAFIAPHTVAQSSSAPSGFPPLDQWKSAILAGDAAALKALYSTTSPADVQANGAAASADADVSFWLGLKARSMRIDIVRLKERPGAESVIFQAEVKTDSSNGEGMNMTDAQAWQKQGDQWRIVGVERTDAPHLKQPSDMKKNIYPDDADAHAEIKDAEEKTAVQRKRMLLVFGANWCYDCHVLDLAFQRPDFATVMAGYEVVHIDIGADGKKNADLVKQFDIPLNKGVPALAVAESDGTLVVSQKNGEFEDARALTPEALLAFLKKWRRASP
jgi:hypothetical protein